MKYGQPAVCLLAFVPGFIVQFIVFSLPSAVRYFAKAPKGPLDTMLDHHLGEVWLFSSAVGAMLMLDLVLDLVNSSRYRWWVRLLTIENVLRYIFILQVAVCAVWLYAAPDAPTKLAVHELFVTFNTVQLLLHYAFTSTLVAEVGGGRFYIVFWSVIYSAIIPGIFVSAIVPLLQFQMKLFASDPETFIQNQNQRPSGPILAFLIYIVYAGIVTIALVAFKAYTILQRLLILRRQFFVTDMEVLGAVCTILHFAAPSLQHGVHPSTLSSSPICFFALKQCNRDVGSPEVRFEPLSQQHFCRPLTNKFFPFLLLLFLPRTCSCITASGVPCWCCSRSCRSK